MDGVLRSVVWMVCEGSGCGWCVKGQWCGWCVKGQGCGWCVEVSGVDGV